MHNIEFDITEFAATYSGGDSGNSARTHKHKPAEKDDVVSVLIPDNISECALSAPNTHMQPYCMSKQTMTKVTNIVGISDISSVKTVLGCESERCVLSKLAKDLGEELVNREISRNLKVRGPTDNKLLNNVDIDTTMGQWGLHNPEFYPYNFHMLNYASYSYNNGRIYNTPDTLVTIPIDVLVSGKYNGTKYKCAGCIINTDTYQGNGVHWMALFVDTRTKPATAEFFNSSGNAPAPEWVNWMEKTKNILISMGMPSEIVRASTIRHQKSKTECGLYSLFYVWARLHNVPVAYFANNRISDQLMFEFRQHLFDDPSRPKFKKFNWEEYTAVTKLTWE